MSTIKHKVLVLSGKGGVGKSTFSSQLAFSLAQKGFQVGLLDVDICGPSIPQMLGLVGSEVHRSASGWSPVYVEDNLGVMSIGFMLPSADDAVIWRGARKTGIIKQFFTDIAWGDLDYLIIDTPPGTSDEHISVVQSLKGCDVDGAVVVTTPQEVAMADVRKELNFCKKTDLRVLGVVENMSHLSLSMDVFATATQPGCQQAQTPIRFVDSKATDVTQTVLEKLSRACPELLSGELNLCIPLFSAQLTSSSSGVDDGSNGDAESAASRANNPRLMAQAFGVPYLGELPMDPLLLKACEQGVGFAEAFPQSPAAPYLANIVDQIVTATGPASVNGAQDENAMRIS
jgi:Mrp family chromosome partitioning ATPase